MIIEDSPTVPEPLDYKAFLDDSLSEQGFWPLLLLVYFVTHYMVDDTILDRTLCTELFSSM